MSNRGVESFRKPTNGYTILEVLIFIAVSGLVFVAAMGAVSGRQQQVQFSQSVREFEAKIRDVLNDVSTGYYPTNSMLSCTVASSPTVRPLISNVSSGLGTNSECLYVGKALQFVPHVSTEKESKFLIYNLAGRRYGAGTTTVKNITDALPVAVADTSATPFADSVETAQLRFGVEITKVFDIVGGTEYGVIGVLTGFEGSNPAATSVSSNHVIQIGGILSGTVDLDATKAEAVTLINKLTEDSSATEGYISTSLSGIVICLRGGNGKKASVTIGANGSSATLLQIDDYNVGCDL